MTSPMSVGMRKEGPRPPSTSTAPARARPAALAAVWSSGLDGAGIGLLRGGNPPQFDVPVSGAGLIGADPDRRRLVDLPGSQADPLVREVLVDDLLVVQPRL